MNVFLGIREASLAWAKDVGGIIIFSRMHTTAFLGYLVVWVWLTGESDWVPIVLYTSRLFACIGAIQVIRQILGIEKMDSLKLYSDKIVI